MTESDLPKFYDYNDLQRWLHQEKSPVVISLHKHHDPNLPLHSHNFIEIVVVNSGRGRHTLKDYEHPLLAGDIFIIPRGMEHGYVNEDKLVITNILFQVATIESHFPEISKMPEFFSFFVADSMPEMMNNKVCHLMNLNQDEMVYLEGLTNRISLEQRNDKTGSYSMCLTYLAQTLIYFIRLLEAGAGSHLPGNANGRFSMVYGYISKHLGDKIRLADLAALVYMSPRNFQRIFTKENGISPSKYILKARLEKSRDYLRDTTWDIGMIAVKTGFQDHSYYTMQFNKMFGLSPREYRNTMQQR